MIRKLQTIYQNVQKRAEYCFAFIWEIQKWQNIIGNWKIHNLKNIYPKTMNELSNCSAIYELWVYVIWESCRIKFHAVYKNWLKGHIQIQFWENHNSINIVSNFANDIPKWSATQGLFIYVKMTTWKQLLLWCQFQIG